MVDNLDDELARLLEQRAAGVVSFHDDEGEPLPSEVKDLIEVADLVWERAQGAPPIEKDPVAAMLGLVPDSSRYLDGQALKTALRQSGVKTSELGERLRNRGWEVSTADVFNWQNRGADNVPPALIQAVAEVMDVAAERLMIDRSESVEHGTFSTLLSSPRFEALVERWATLRGTTPSLASSALEARLATSVYRGSRPTDEALLDALEALVNGLEPGD